jgi:hypothetical protein
MLFMSWNCHDNLANEYNLELGKYNILEQCSGRTFGLFKNQGHRENRHCLVTSTHSN